MIKTIKDAVFHAQQDPYALAKIINGLCHTPENIGADIALADKAVVNGTALATVKATLPTKQLFNTAMGLPVEATITWGADTTPTYAPAVAGTYALTGTLSGLPAILTNTGNKVVTVDLVVAEA